MRILADQATRRWNQGGGKPRIKPKPKRNYRFWSNSLQNTRRDVTPGTPRRAFWALPHRPWKGWRVRGSATFRFQGALFSPFSAFFSFFFSLFSFWGRFWPQFGVKREKNTKKNNKYAEDSVKTSDQTRGFRFEGAPEGLLRAPERLFFFSSLPSLLFSRFSSLFSRSGIDVDLKRLILLSFWDSWDFKNLSIP